MGCIDPNRALPWKTPSREFVLTLSGALAFAVTTVVLYSLLFLTPVVTNMAHLTGYVLLSALDAASLTAFILGIYFYSRKQKTALLSAVIGDMKTAKPAKVEKSQVQHTETSLNYTEKVRKELPPLFGALGEFLKAFATGYYQSEGVYPPDLQIITTAMQEIHGQIDDFLGNPEEVLRVAIGMFSLTLIDETKMGDLLQKTNSQVIDELANTLASSNRSSEWQSQLMKQIFQVITKDTKMAKGAFISRIDALRLAYANMRDAQGEEKKNEKTADYNSALTNLIDYLYSHAEIPQEKIETWAAHLVPSFLEIWRESLFQKIAVSIERLKHAYGKNGMFNNTTKQAFSGLATTFFGKKYTERKIEKSVNTLLLLPERKAVLENAVKHLVPVILTPFLGATFKASHPYRKKVEAIVLSADFTPPKVEGKEWKTSIEAYAAFFRKIAKKFRD